MKVAILCFKKDMDKLKNIVEYLSTIYETEVVFYEDWERILSFDCIVAYMAAGIIIRKLCPFLKSKWEDPAVIVLDKPLKHAIVILGGHRGGNEVARQLEKLGIKAIITTAMEFSDGISVGVGFRKNAKANDIIKAIMNALKEIGCGVDDVRVISTVEGKERSEIVKVAEILKRPLIFVKKDELNSLDVRETEAVRIGVKNVAEGCAILVSRDGKLILPKRVYGGVTIAIAR